MTGWKTVVFGIAVILLGGLQQFSEALKNCAVDTASHTTVCQMGLPGWAISVIGMVIVVLRAFTTSPIGEKKE
jgi:hypothetical protein